MSGPLHGLKSASGAEEASRVLLPRCLPSAGQQPQQPGAPPQQDYTKAWEEYYKKQGELYKEKNSNRDESAA